MISGGIVLNSLNMRSEIWRRFLNASITVKKTSKRHYAKTCGTISFPVEMIH